MVEGVLKRQEIEIAWQNQDEAIITSGLQPGDKLVLTSLGQVTSGIRVNIAIESDRAERPADMIKANILSEENL